MNKIAKFVPPRSPVRVMSILEELAAEGTGLPLIRLCERLEMPKTSLLSLLRALEEEKYVESVHGVYRLGEASLRLSSSIASTLPFPHSVHAALVALSRATDETALLGVMATDGEAAVYVDKVECQRPIRFSGFIGSRRPLYCTGMGKILLAFQDPALTRKYLDKTELVKMTPRTIVDPAYFERELQGIRTAGFSSAIEEHTEGVATIAAPIFDGFGTLIAGVSVAGPAERIRASFSELAVLAVNAAVEMSEQLGYRGDRSRQARA